MAAKELDKLKKYERRFSRNKYNGSKKPGFVILPGTVPVMISAPHAVNQMREGQGKWADKYTGAVALLLHELTGCHIIYASGYTGGDPNYDDLASNPYQKALIEYVRSHKIPVLLDLHGASTDRPYAVEMGTAPDQDAAGNVSGDPDPSLKGNAFISKLIRLSFQYVLGRLDRDCPLDVWQNKIFDAGGQNTVTKSISMHTDTAAVQLEINGLFRTPETPERMLALIHGLTIIVGILSRVHWGAEYIDVFKLRQSKAPLPQDKVDISIHTPYLSNGARVEVNSFKGVSEHVYVKDVAGEEDCIYFTNRLILNMFGEEWRNDLLSGNRPRLEDAPVLVSDRRESALSFPIGITKALKLDKVYLSSRLYHRLLPLSGDNSFILYNKYTDSRLFLDFDEESDYRDDPPVVPAEKVMLPRYFKQLLGYNTSPFKLIRKEEKERFPAFFKEKLKTRIDRIMSSFSQGTEGQLKSEPVDAFILGQEGDYQTVVKRILEEGVERYVSVIVNRLCQSVNDCYEPVEKTPFLQVKDGCDKRTSDTVGDIFNRFGFYDSVEILIVPKQKVTSSSFSRFKGSVSRGFEWWLERIIGKSDFLLTTCWTNETDDKNYVARLSPDMMSLLGISDNDKVVINYGERMVTLRTLANPELTNYQISIPANARTHLNMYSVNDVVIVSRDMRHTLKRNSQAQTVTILGTVLAVFQVIDQLWVGVILCVIFVPVIVYFSLNEERIKVK